MYNSKVERHSFGITKMTEHTRISESAAANDYLQKKAVLEHYNAIDQSMVNSEKEFQTKEAISNITMHKLLESQIPVLINQLHHTGREVIFKDILFEMFSKSLVLDEEFVIEQEENLRALIESYVDGKGGYKLLENAFRETKSPFLKAIKTVCESTATKVARRKLSDAQENQLDVSAIKFELNDDEKDGLDYDKEKISVDKLSELVKNKVLTVVQDEKARQAKEDEVYQDLEAQAKDQGADDDAAVQESIRRSILKDTPVEESTLFNSLFRHSYKEMLESSVSAHVSMKNTTDDDSDDVENYNVDATEKDIMVSEFQEDTSVKGESESHGSVQSDIDMDLILAESITKYTLMELAHTIQLENYSYDSVRKISQQLLN